MHRLGTTTAALILPTLAFCAGWVAARYNAGRTRSVPVLDDLTTACASLDSETAEAVRRIQRRLVGGSK